MDYWVYKWWLGKKHMGAAEQTGGAVESHLSTLEETYDSFAVNQRTVAVSSGQYEREQERSDCEIELHAKVENDDGEVLHLQEDGSGILPSTLTTPDDSLEPTLQEAVQESTGIDCAITSISSVTILGVRDAAETDRDPVYRLAAVFEGEHDGGSLNEDAEWKQFEMSSHPVYA